jgi:hypothetical protein
LINRGSAHCASAGPRASARRIDCGKKITDSLIGKDVEILDSARRLPEGHRLIVGDSSKVTL